MKYFCTPVYPRQTKPALKILTPVEALKLVKKGFDDGILRNKPDLEHIRRATDIADAIEATLEEYDT